MHLLRGYGMDRLLEIGFQYVGKWKLLDNALALELNRMSAQRNVLYAFVMDQSVLYVGKTASTLEARLGGYLRPHSTQRTNVRNNQALVQLLRDGKLVELYAWADSGLHRVGQFHLNYAAGLEDSIIQSISPPWNGARSSAQTQAELPSITTTPALNEVAPTDLGSSVIQEDYDVTSAAEVKELEAKGVLNAAPAFQVKLGKTYFNHGFFNVPVKFSSFFPEHGSEISVYCGDARTLVRAVVDRKANQTSGTPRIYGKSSLTAWFNKNRKLDDEVTIRVISRNEIELR